MNLCSLLCRKVVRGRAVDVRGEITFILGPQKDQWAVYTYF